MRSWHLEIEPHTGTRQDPTFGEITVTHAQQKVYYRAPNVQTRTGRVHIGFVADKFDVFHELPQIRKLDAKRREEIVAELVKMTGRPLRVGAHTEPYVLVRKDEVQDLDEEPDVIELDE